MYCTQPSWLKKCKFPNTIFILWPRHIHCYNFINDTEDMLCKETASLNRMQHCPSMFSLPVALVKVIMITLVTDQLPKCLQTSWQSLTQLKFKTPSLKCYNQWCIAKNGGGYTQRGVAKGLKVPYLFMITEVSIRCQKNPDVGIRRIPAYTPPIHHWLQRPFHSKNTNVQYDQMQLFICQIILYKLAIWSVFNSRHPASSGWHKTA